MKAVIKRIHSPDVSDFSNYRPKDLENFSFLLQVMVGPEGQEGEESFDIVVCTPKWLSKHFKREDVIVGRHHLILLEYNFDRMMKKITSFIADCTGDSWKEIAIKIGRLGKWEFEDYKPCSNK